MNITPARGSRVLLAAIPFFLIVMVYIVGSAERRAANPEDKLLPPISEMADTTKRLAAEPDLYSDADLIERSARDRNSIWELVKLT